MKPRILTLACLMAIATLPARAFDLMEAWRQARGYDAAFAAAGYDRDAGHEKAPQGRAGLLPQVGLSADYSRTNLLEPSSHGSFSGYGAGVQLTQPLFDVGKYTGYQKGKTASALADTRYAASEQQLIVDVAQAYFDVLLAQDTLASTQATKKAFASQLEQAKTAFEVGTATITDTHEAQAGYDGAVAQEILAESDLEIKRNALRRLTGLDPLGVQAVTPNLPLDQPTTIGLDDWTAQALANNLDIKAQEQNLQLASQDLTEKRGQHLPVVSLTAGYSDNTDNSPFNSFAQTRASSVGVQLTLPLYAGGGIDSRVREAAANENSAKDKLEASRRQVREQVRQAYLGVTSGAAFVKAQQQLLVSAKSKLDSTRLGKEVGVRTNLDLLQAEQEYYNVQTQLAKARYSYLLAKLQLAQAAGRLGPEQLAEVNAFIVR
ncbi:TolC family outer membrane protein [Pseudogulbenkiania sp. MAI-1]|uniref:TolC family outer membrane protein n=1 Tax=Pseudogulbenkiania sp. MAI-1 TaxID=990370 RepID=UPI00045E9F49|nr:TolC family outer membrane protein [Pseudogulbenkiania sp. MAI-1]